MKTVNQKVQISISMGNRIDGIDKSLDTMIIFGQTKHSRFAQLEQERQWCMEVMELAVAGSSENYSLD